MYSFDIKQQRYCIMLYTVKQKRVQLINWLLKAIEA